MRASWFNQNFSEGYLLDGVLAGKIALPAGPVPEPFIDTDDMADVAVAALTDDRHKNKLYEVTGPRALTFADAAAEIPQAVRRTIRYRQVSPEEFATSMRPHVPGDIVEPHQKRAVDAALAESLLKLKLTGPYDRETDWVFVSLTMKGKQPLWPETLWRRHGRPAVKAAGITKRVAFHTFRHTYTTLLTQNNEDVKVVQELLRHANSRITLDLYAQAGMPEKPQAQSRLVERVLRKGKAAV